MRISAVCALMVGCVGWIVGSLGVVLLIEPLASQVPREKHIPFLANLWAHSAGYACGFLGGFFLVIRVWRTRRDDPPEVKALVIEGDPAELQEHRLQEGPRKSFQSSFDSHHEIFKLLYFFLL